MYKEGARRWMGPWTPVKSWDMLNCGGGVISVYPWNETGMRLK